MDDAERVGGNTDGHAPANSLFKIDDRAEQVAAVRDVTEKMLKMSAAWSSDVNRAKVRKVDVLGNKILIFSIEYENEDKLNFVDEQILKALQQLAKDGVESALYNLFDSVRQKLTENVTLGGTLLLARLGSSLDLVARAKRDKEFYALTELEKRGIVKKRSQ